MVPGAENVPFVSSGNWRKVTQKVLFLSSGYWLRCGWLVVNSVPSSVQENNTRPGSVRCYSAHWTATMLKLLSQFRKLTPGRLCTLLICSLNCHHVKEPFSSGNWHQGGSVRCYSAHWTATMLTLLSQFRKLTPGRLCTLLLCSLNYHHVEAPVSVQEIDTRVAL